MRIKAWMNQEASRRLELKAPVHGCLRSQSMAAVEPGEKHFGPGLLRQERSEKLFWLAQTSNWLHPMS
jgi:hypothetical protein